MNITQQLNKLTNFKESRVYIGGVGWGKGRGNDMIIVTYLKTKLKCGKH